MQYFSSFLRFFFILLFLFLSSVSYATEWKKLSPGLEYKILSSQEKFSMGKIHAFRVDLSKYRFIINFPKDGNRFDSLKDKMEKNHALIAINGGFFDENLKPIGLRVSQKKKKYPLKPISWWGVFYVRGNKAYLSSYKQYRPSHSTDFAIQAGPRLIINGRIPSLKPGFANRTALGITPRGKVIILVTENKLLTTNDLAKIMKKSEAKGGLNCYNAINLDGGTSSQLYAHIKNFKLKITGLKRIADSILLVNR